MSSRRIYRFSKPSKIAQDFICTICSEVLYDAVKLPCGHVMCDTCIMVWIKKNHSCPLCRREIKPGQIDIASEIRKEIEKFPVVCRFPQCCWTGPKKEILAHEGNCMFSPRKSNAEVLELLPHYDKSGENDIETPCTSLITSLYLTHPDLISKVLLKKPHLETICEEMPWSLQKVKKFKKPKLEKSQKTLESYFKTIN